MKNQFHSSSSISRTLGFDFFFSGSHSQLQHFYLDVFSVINISHWPRYMKRRIKDDVDLNLAVEMEESDSGCKVARYEVTRYPHRKEASVKILN